MQNLLIIDLESTCFERGREPAGFFSEIIEIGAVWLDGGELKIKWEFDAFVKPVVFPELSPFCRKLMTISQAEVDLGVPLQEALDRLTKKVGTAPYRFASWGFYDRKQFEGNCSRFQIPYPFPPDHISLKHEFAKLVKKRAMGMGEALKFLHLPLEGTHHRGLDDAKNIARIAIWMIDKGWRPL